MQTHYITFLIILVSINMFAQWEWQNPTPFGNALSKIQFLNNSIGYASGRYGTIIKTTNGGEEWIQLNAGTEATINDIFFLTEDIGWFITYGERTIYKTTNGGIEWNLIGNLTPRYAYSLWFINEMRGFAGGYQSLLSTTDGGVTWNEINSIHSTGPIYFINSNIGFVGGFNVIYRTTNGGVVWETISLPTSQFATSSIFALDPNKIYLVGSGDFEGNPYHIFLKTTDGGSSWDGESFEYRLSDVYFESLFEGWVCSNKIYKTIDRGNTWEPTNFSASKFDFYENHSWAISGWNTIIHSDDLWLTAEQQIKSVFSGFLWDGAAKDTNMVFASGSNKTIIGSLDGGKTWNKYFESVNQTYLNSITFNNDDIWVVGESGVVLKSTDNGNAWEESTINASWLSDIEFISSSIGYIVGTINGLACIYGTQDGGKSWELQQTFPEFTSIDGIKFSRDDLGWMIANRDGLLKSTDMGRTWNVVYDSVPWFEDIAVFGDTAWFSYSNKVLKTTDAGNSWETVNVFNFQGSSFWGFGIDFVSSKIGYAGTYDSRVFKTTDGGTIWIEEDFPSAMPIFAIDFVDDQRGWTFGNIGTILKRDPNYTDIQNEDISSYATYFNLSQNYPNPFNPSTSIHYAISSPQFVTIKVYDLLGKEIVTLVNEEKPAGNYEVEFNAANLPSGIYFYRIKAGNFIETKKMVLLR